MEVSWCHHRYDFLICRDNTQIPKAEPSQSLPPKDQTNQFSAAFSTNALHDTKKTLPISTAALIPPTLKCLVHPYLVLLIRTKVSKGSSLRQILHRNIDAE